MAVSTRGTKSSKTRSRAAATRGGATRNVAVRPRAHKWVYRFDEGSASMRDLLGGKGAGVAEMTRAGLPVPPGFTITTEACNAFYARGATFPGRSLGAGGESAQGRREDHRQGVWRRTQSAARQCPQRREVLDARNDGHGPQPRPELGRRSKASHRSPRTGVSRSTRIVASSSSSARSFSASTASSSRKRSTRIKKRKKAKTDADLKRPSARGADHRVPRDRQAPLAHRLPRGSHGRSCARAIGAVFDSWNNKRATDYRNYNRIPHDLGTAVNVQSMVFGNMGDDSGHRRCVHA